MAEKEQVNILPVILAGGSGARLWPLSRELYPKQLLSLTGEYSFFQETLLRIKGLSVLPPIIICNQDYRFLIEEQYKKIEGLPDTPTIILEPEGRNTAPAIAAAAFYALEKYAANTVLLVLPADQLMSDISIFQEKVRQALSAAKEEMLVTFGVVPKHPATGYGYIKTAAPYSDTVFHIECFVEKPNVAMAEEFLSQGDYLWNSGIFMFSSQKILNEIQQFLPEVYIACQKAVENAVWNHQFLQLSKADFSTAMHQSIDYGVMEKTTDAVVVLLPTYWSDMGSWDAIVEAAHADENGNVLNGDIINLDTKNCYLRAQTRLVATIGIEDLIVIETKDAVLIAHKETTQKVRDIAQQLKQADRHEVLVPTRTFRPWGYFENLESGTNFRVKKICISPGQSLSLQLHNFRAEHWVVVSGEASVICGDKKLTLIEGESIYIPQQTKHCLSNNTHIPLEVIEVQSGSYLEEDDIIRFEDQYGRV